VHAKVEVAAGYIVKTQSQDAANQLVSECENPDFRNQCECAIADSIGNGLTCKDVRIQTCEKVKNRRLDVATRLHSAERMLQQLYSSVKLSYTIAVEKAREAAVSLTSLEGGAVKLPIAMNNVFQSDPSISNLQAESASLSDVEYTEYDDNGKLVTTTSTTSTVVLQSTLAADSATNTAAMAGIVAGIIFCVLFICFIIAIVCYMMSRKNDEPNLNQGNQNQPGTESESEGDPQATADVVAGVSSPQQAHVREFQV